MLGPVDPPLSRVSVGSTVAWLVTTFPPRFGNQESKLQAVVHSCSRIIV